MRKTGLKQTPTMVALLFMIHILSSFVFVNRADDLTTVNGTTIGMEYNYTTTVQPADESLPEGVFEYETFPMFDLEFTQTGNSSLERLAYAVKIENPFPIRIDNFAGIENQTHKHLVEIQQGICLQNSLCNVTFSFILFRPSPRGKCCGDCSCDLDTCQIRGTCCPDILLTTFGEFPPRQKTPQNCIQMNIGSTSQEGIYGVDNCPVAADKELKRKCTQEYTRQTIYDLYDITPCVDKMSTTVYRNKYCALCNSNQEKDLDLLYFEIKFICSQMLENGLGGNYDEILDKIFSEKVCSVSFSNPLPCVGENCNSDKFCNVAVSSCNVTGNWKDYDADIEEACLSYTSNYMDPSMGPFGERFKNVFCYICNGYDPKLGGSCEWGFHPGGSTNIFSFSGLLKLNSDIDAEMDVQATKLVIILI